MSFLDKIGAECKIISIVGMAKNAGKTTALNYLIEEAYDEEIVLGITSSGRDGESIDLVTGTDKPKIFVYEGSIISVPISLYEVADAGLEILLMTNYTTPIGKILICKVREAGYVQIAGPLNVSDHRKMCAMMQSFGAKLIIVDGAIDRKAIAAPEMADGIILSTGAVISRSLKKVVNETAHVVSIFSLNRVADAKIVKIVSNYINEKKIIFVDKNYEIKESLLQTGLNAGRYLDEMIDDDCRYIFLPGALTLSVIEDIHPAKYKNIEFIVKDATKIFIDSISWRQLLKKGMLVRTFYSVAIIALTINPHSPLGYSFEQKELLKAMKESIVNIPIIDVKRN